MLTLDISGKTGSKAVEIVRSSLKDDSEVKISIDGPEQFENLRKFLVSEGGFNDVTLEDDDGILYVIASGRSIELPEESNITEQESQQESSEQDKILLAPIESEPVIHEIIAPVKNTVIRDSLAVILSYENKKYRPAFMQKFIRALKDSRIKPTVIALMDNAVSLAAYNSRTCEDLKTLEDSGVEVFVSDSCADRLGLTEALGVGISADMNEILAKIFECEKVVSL